MSDLEIPPAENFEALSLPDAQYKMETGKLDCIDALRGIAALSIFIYHIYVATGIYPIQIIPERFIGLTLAGVPLFFILSAFTLYSSLDNRAGEKRKFFKFYLRRFFRIAPLFYLLLIIVVLDSLIMQKTVPSRQDILVNFTFTNNLVPQYSMSLFSDGWTVGVEMLFYLVVVA